jgi:hypothetical protein
VLLKERDSFRGQLVRSPLLRDLKSTSQSYTAFVSCFLVFVICQLKPDPGLAL